MNKDKIQLKANTKWARDLQLDHIPLESYFGDIKSICKVNNVKNSSPHYNKLREFYFKFLHRTIVTKKELFLYGKESNILPNERFNNPHLGLNNFSRKLSSGSMPKIPPL